MNQHPYDLLLQAQADVYAPLDLTIQPAQKTCVSSQGNSLLFTRVMNGEDMNFTVEQGARTGASPVLTIYGYASSTTILGCTSI